MQVWPWTIANKYVVILALYYLLVEDVVFGSYIQYSMLVLLRRTWFPSTTNTKKILTKTMLSFLVTSNSSVTAVYNEVIVDIQ